MPGSDGMMTAFSRSLATRVAHGGSSNLRISAAVLSTLPEPAPPTAHHSQERDATRRDSVGSILRPDFCREQPFAVLVSDGSSRPTSAAQLWLREPLFMVESERGAVTLGRACVFPPLSF